jgi:hypothetical protein
MNRDTMIRRWKSELANAVDNPGGIVELDQLDKITGADSDTCTQSCTCSVAATSCCTITCS